MKGHRKVRLANRPNAKLISAPVISLVGVKLWPLGQIWPAVRLCLALEAKYKISTRSLVQHM